MQIIYKNFHKNAFAYERAEKILDCWVYPTYQRKKINMMNIDVHSLSVQFVMTLINLVNGYWPLHCKLFLVIIGFLSSPPKL